MTALNDRIEVENRLLHRVIETISSSLDLDVTLRETIALVREATRGEAVFLHLWNPERRRLTLRAASDGFEDVVGRVTLRMGEGIAGRQPPRAGDAIARGRHRPRTPHRRRHYARAASGGGPIPDRAGGAEQRLEARSRVLGRALPSAGARPGRATHHRRRPGFDLEAQRAGRPDTSFGLLGMAERAELIGSRLTVDGAAGRGTTVELCLPVGEDSAP